VKAKQEVEDIKKNAGNPYHHQQQQKKLLLLRPEVQEQTETPSSRTLSIETKN
jgi:hypothetical protein